MSQSNLNVLTIATGKKLYLDMAINLARSFWLWNSESGIKFYLATDQPGLLSEDVKGYVNIISLKPGELGLGFSPKLHLDELAPQGQTLFIDSDCLVYGDLLPLFEKFKGHTVSVIGNYIEDGEWFGDVSSICKKFNITHLPKFNGGIYYIENGAKAASVYETARNFESQYDDIGFVRLRGRPNDEVLMALSMQLNHEAPVDDDGSVLAEFVNFQSGIKSDLLNGVAELYNKPGHPAYQKNWHLTIARPLVVHFLGHHNHIMPYTKEVEQLKYIYAAKYPHKAAIALSYFKITLPSVLISSFKSLMRPVYRLLFQTRKIKKSERIVD